MSEKPATILIVDDDKTVVEQLVTHFRRRGYEPIATANPTMVEQTLEAFEVHLILLDLRMERLDGYHVLARLREKKIMTPVLIITAYYDDERERLETVGITSEDVIEKPFRDFSKIEGIINRKLNKIVAPGEVGSDYEDEIYYDNNTKVMIVEDEVEISENLSEVLKERNYEVTTFNDGKSALAYITENRGVCDIAIIDIAIPGIPGDELIKKITEMNKDIKIIPVSSKYIEEVKEKLRSIGFDPGKLVTKPFNLSRLVEQIKVLATEAGTLGNTG
jgi:DNA-binding response OmpR family regulator